jgi:diguanylate cyclase (GGDEF)-like protein
LVVALACWLVRKLRRMHKKLRRARRHAQATLQAIDDAVITVDARDQSIRFVNATALHQAGAQALVGLPLRTAYPLSPDSMARLIHAIADCLARCERVHLPDLLELYGAVGLRTLRARASPIYSPLGRPDSVALVFTDVTDAMAATQRLDRAAHHDALTGLPNRSLLQERLLLALSRVQRRGSQAAILFLDLDNFKHINDSLGHRTGDQVLKLLAERLSALCRDTDTVARWGGDEFVVLLEDVDGPDGATTAAAKLVEVLSQDLVLGPEFNHLRLPSAASVGVALAPRDGMDMEELLSRADAAMYSAKAQRGGGFQFWSRDMDVPMRSRPARERGVGTNGNNFAVLPPFPHAGEGWGEGGDCASSGTSGARKVTGVSGDLP